MKRFPHGHATHPQWRMAVGLVLAQLKAQMALPDHAASPTLGLVYMTDHCEPHAQEILDLLCAELPEVTDWSGTVGVGIAAHNAEYVDEPAVSVMLCDIAPDQYRVFSGVAPLGPRFEAAVALLHVDPSIPELADLVAEMADRTTQGYVFGGLTSSRGAGVQFALSGNGNLSGHGAAGGVFSGGLSGVAFGPRVALLSRVSQGCQPLRNVQTGRVHTRRVTACDRNVVLALDGQPALEVLLGDLGVSIERPSAVMAAVRSTLVGVVDGPDPGDGVQRTGALGHDVVVRHIMGLDPARQGLAVAREMEVGEAVVFCQRHAQAARADLMRICAEIREELEPAEAQLDDAGADGREGDLRFAAAPARPVAAGARQMAGAVYVSCAGRGGAHFGGPSAELQIVRHALGDVPVVGFFAAGEVGHAHVYSYTGVLTVFLTEA